MEEEIITPEEPVQTEPTVEAPVEAPTETPVAE
jgi:hypothetical protein